MQEKLVIYLHVDMLSQPSWLVIDADGECKEQTSFGDPLNLAALASGREVIVIVPAESISLLSATLPSMPRARLLRALPFAIEEQLVDDVELLHFAAGIPDESGTVSVAVVSKEMMLTWKALLQSWHVNADKMLPLTLAIPLQENELHVVVDEMIDVRTNEFAGFACDSANLMTCLNLAFTDAHMMPSSIIIHNATTEPCADRLKVTAEVAEDFLTKIELLELLARTVNVEPAINLLQGDFATKRSRLPKTQRLIQGGKALIVTWLALLILYPVISYFILGEKLNAINGEINHIYLENFPQASSIIAPKIRMKDKLQQLEGQTGQNQLLLLLGYVSDSLASAKNVKLNRIDYQAGVLTMELTAASSDDFSSFADSLSAAGLNVKQENATLSGTHVNATLQVQ